MASEKLRMGAKGHAIDPKAITLRIFPNGSGTPTFDAEGGVASVSRSSAGKFLVTLNEPYYKPIDIQATVQSGNSDTVDLYAQIGALNNVGLHNGASIGTPGLPTTITVLLKTGTANTDIAANQQVCVFLKAIFEDTAR